MVRKRTVRSLMLTFSFNSRLQIPNNTTIFQTWIPIITPLTQIQLHAARQAILKHATFPKSGVQEEDLYLPSPTLLIVRGGSVGCVVGSVTRIKRTGIIMIGNDVLVMLRGFMPTSCIPQNHVNKYSGINKSNKCDYRIPDHVCSWN